MEKYLKIAASALGALICGIILLNSGGATEMLIQKVDIRYGSPRPFSFYYPYNYQYYTPHKKPYSNSYNSPFYNGSYNFNYYNCE